MCTLAPSDIGGGLFYESPSSSLLVYNGGRMLGAKRSPTADTGEQAWNNFTNTKVAICGVGTTDWGLRSEWHGLELLDFRRHTVHVFGDVWFNSVYVTCRTNNSIADTGTRWRERMYNRREYQAFRACECTVVGWLGACGWLVAPHNA